MIAGKGMKPIKKLMGVRHDFDDMKIVKRY
jgi:UDP-N-acetylmuramyl tripeptide synthase